MNKKLKILLQIFFVNFFPHEWRDLLEWHSVFFNSYLGKMLGKMQFSFEKLWQYRSCNLTCCREGFKKTFDENNFELKIKILSKSRVRTWESPTSNNLLKIFVLKASELKGWDYFMSWHQKTEETRCRVWPWPQTSLFPAHLAANCELCWNCSMSFIKPFNFFPNYPSHF